MSATPLARFTGHQGPVYALAKSSTPDTFLSGAGDHRVVRWQLDKPDDGVLVADAGQAVFALHVAGDRLLIGDEHGGLHVVDTAQGKEVQLEQVHRKGLFAIVSLPEERLVCAGGDGSISVWHIAKSSVLLLRQIPLCEEKVRGLAVSPDGASLAVACGDGTVRILDTTDLNERHTLQVDARGVTSTAWHPQKPVLLSGGKDGHVRLWRSDRGFAPLLDLKAHSGSVYAIAFDAEGRYCASASRDKTAKVWDAQRFDAVARLDRSAGGHTHSVNALCWSNDVLLTAGDDQRVIAWKMPAADALSGA